MSLIGWSGKERERERVGGPTLREGGSIERWERLRKRIVDRDLASY